MARKPSPWGAWVAQSIKRPTSAHVMISRFVSSTPVLGSVLTAQSLEPASDSVSPPLSVPPLLTLCVFLSLKNKMLKKFFFKENDKPISLGNIGAKFLYKGLLDGSVG